MSIVTEKYIRKAFEIDAVQVTEENIEELARWCGGEIRTEKHGRKEVPYVQVRVNRPLNERQTKAFVGDWVLYAGTGYKVYTNKAFLACFEKMTPQLIAVDYRGIRLTEDQLGEYGGSVLQ